MDGRSLKASTSSDWRARLLPSRAPHREKNEPARQEARPPDGRKKKEAYGEKRNDESTKLVAGLMGRRPVATEGPGESPGRSVKAERGNGLAASSSGRAPARKAAHPGSKPGQPAGTGR